MGYYTSFTLEWNGPAEAVEDFKSDLNSGTILTNKHADPLKDYVSYHEQENYVDSHKWYSWSEDMVAISAQYPHIHMILWGDGEDGDDNWRADFIAGEFNTTMAKIVYDELPEEFISKIKEAQDLPYERAHPQAGKVIEEATNWYEHY